MPEPTSFRRHATTASIAAGCSCDGCRLWARVHPMQPLDDGRTMLDAAPFGQVVRAVLASGVHVDVLAAFCGVSYGTIRDLRDGKASIQQGTATKLRRMAMLLPDEAIETDEDAFVLPRDPDNVRRLP